MELTHWTVYWITRCDNVKALLGGAAFAITCFAAGYLIVEIERVRNERWRAQLPGATQVIAPRLPGGGVAVQPLRLARAYCLGAAAVLVWIGCALMPTTKDACAILVLPPLAQNEDVRGIGNDVLGLAREWLEELRPEEE